MRSLSASASLDIPVTHLKHAHSADAHSDLQAERHVYCKTKYLGVNTCMVSQCMSLNVGKTNPLVVAKTAPVEFPVPT